MMTEIGLYRDTSQPLLLTKAHSVPLDSPYSELEHAQNTIGFERFCALMSLTKT